MIRGCIDLLSIYRDMVSWLVVFLFLPLLLLLVFLRPPALLFYPWWVLNFGLNYVGTTFLFSSIHFRLVLLGTRRQVTIFFSILFIFYCLLIHCPVHVSFLYTIFLFLIVYFVSFFIFFIISPYKNNYIAS